MTGHSTRVVVAFCVVTHHFAETDTSLLCADVLESLHNVVFHFVDLRLKYFFETHFELLSKMSRCRLFSGQVVY